MLAITDIVEILPVVSFVVMNSIRSKIWIHKARKRENEKSSLSILLGG